MTEADHRPTPASALTGALGGAVEDLHRLTGGASRATWSFVHVDPGGTPRPRILQVARSRVAPGAGMAVEADLLRAAGRAGVPVPPVVASGDDDGFGAGWMVTERMAGETIPRKLLRDPEFAAARASVTAQCGRALAGIHSIDPTAVPALAGGDQLDEFEGVLDALGPVFAPRPALELGLRRLRATRPESGGRSVVHGDFRTGNLLLGPEGLRAVLDWELAHLGDPLEDLGWFCVRAWRFGSPAVAGGFGSAAELCAAYQEAAGRAVDPAAVAWWEAVGTFKWAVMCMVQAASHLTGVARSVELAAVGRRVCENEWDLLGLLGVQPAPDDPPAVAPGAGPGAGEGAWAGDLFGRPSAAELVAAVREFLAEDVAGATEGRVRFHTRVAGNVLGVVERQLALGQALTERHAARLAHLGVADDAALARSIRSGACDDRWAEVGPAVAGAVRDQLLVANPGHLRPDGPPLESGRPADGGEGP